MSYQVTYAAHPPQFSVPLDLTQLAARDARFSQLRSLRQRQTLDLAVQDSADLQGVHLNLRLGPSEWVGTPGALDEDGSARRRPFHGWSETALVYALGLDLVPVRQHCVAFADLADQCALWPTGVLYAFACPSGGKPALVRRLNLAGDLDRLEFEFLAATNFAGLDLVRAHHLGRDGGHVLLRAGALGGTSTAAAGTAHGHLRR